MAVKGFAAFLTAALLAGAAYAQTVVGDPVRGGQQFQQRCSICHNADKGGKNGIGPALYGAYGRAAGQAPAYSYSDAIKASGMVWTPDKLDLWVQKPSGLIPGVKMVVPPVSNPQDRADLIAYLKSQSDAPEPKAGKKSKKHDG